MILGCAPAPAEAPPVEEPPPFVPLVRPPPMRTIPDLHPADPAQFVVRANGLGVFDEIPGTGSEVVEGVVVVAEITSWTPDGTLWDSTWERREPARFMVGKGQVVKGWEEGVVGMRAGGVRQLLVPPALGFEHGIGGRLPDGAASTTRFDVLEVLVPPAAPTPPGDPPAVNVGGFEVRDVRVGNGDLLTGDRIARIDYVGWLADSTQSPAELSPAPFDTTWLRSAPFTFRYGADEIRWESAFEGMRVGGRREIVIPAARAFGDEGQPRALLPPDSVGAGIVVRPALAGAIPPDADLVYAVDLQAIE